MPSTGQRWPLRHHGAARCRGRTRHEGSRRCWVTQCACWRYETSLSCQFSSPTDECAPWLLCGCTPSGRSAPPDECAHGRVRGDREYHTCPVASASAVTARNCPTDVSALRAVASTRPESDADFARSMSFPRPHVKAGGTWTRTVSRYSAGEPTAAATACSPIAAAATRLVRA